MCESISHLYVKKNPYLLWYLNSGNFYIEEWCCIYREIVFKNFLPNCNNLATKNNNNKNNNNNKIGFKWLPYFNNYIIIHHFWMILMFSAQMKYNIVVSLLLLSFLRGTRLWWLANGSINANGITLPHNNVTRQFAGDLYRLFILKLNFF